MTQNRPIHCAHFILGLVLLLAVPSGQVQGAVTLTISGNYDTTGTVLYDAAHPNGTPSGNSVFGLTGADNPISISFTFKEIIGAPIVLTTGTVATASASGVSGALTRNWYGYLASDIDSITTSIAGHTWTPAGLSDNELSADGTNIGSLANIWFDQDVTSFLPPGRAIFDLDNSGGTFAGISNGFIIADSSATSGIDTPGIRIGQYQSNDIGSAVETPSTSFTITSNVPEPSKTLCLMLGLATLKLRRKRL